MSHTSTTWLHGRSVSRDTSGLVCHSTPRWPGLDSAGRDPVPSSPPPCFQCFVCETDRPTESRLCVTCTPISLFLHARSYSAVTAGFFQHCPTEMSCPPAAVLHAINDIYLGLCEAFLSQILTSIRQFISRLWITWR